MLFVADTHKVVRVELLVVDPVPLGGGVGDHNADIVRDVVGRNEGKVLFEGCKVERCSDARIGDLVAPPSGVLDTMVAIGGFQDAYPTSIKLMEDHLAAFWRIGWLGELLRWPVDNRATDLALKRDVAARVKPPEATHDVVEVVAVVGTKLFDIRGEEGAMEIEWLHGAVNVPVRDLDRRFGLYVLA